MVLPLCFPFAASLFILSCVDHVITVCNNANNEVCPIWPKRDQIIHWDIEDPVSKLINLNENEKNNIILNTFNVINEKIKNWIKNEE